MGSGNWFRALGGWLAGCAAATVTLYACVLVTLAIAGRGDLGGLAIVGVAGLAYAVPIMFMVTFVLSGFPAALVIWLSEKFHLRSILFFGVAGIAVGLLIHYLLLDVLLRGLAPSPRIGWPFIVAGLVAGLTYWLVAGKHAGRIRSGDQA